MSVVAYAIPSFGVALPIISLWLGHEQPVTTHGYVEADLKMKQRCLDTLERLPGRPSAHCSTIPSDGFPRSPVIMGSTGTAIVGRFGRDPPLSLLPVPIIRRFP